MNWEIRLYTIISSLQENEGFKLHMNQGHLETPVPNMEVWGELGVCVCVDGAQLTFLK